MEDVQLLVMMIFRYDHGRGTGKISLKEGNRTTYILDHFVDIKSLKNYDSKDLRPKLQSLRYFREENLKSLELSREASRDLPHFQP